LKDSGVTKGDAVGVLVLDEKSKIKTDKVGKRSMGKGAGIGVALALVTPAGLGTALDAGNVRKVFKRVCKAAGIGGSWTPRELRTSFVSLMSRQGVSIEEIARLVGHASTRTTEVVYRRELRPVITTGAEIMDEVFGGS
jgi:integrase